MDPTFEAHCHRKMKSDFISEHDLTIDYTITNPDPHELTKYPNKPITVWVYANGTGSYLYDLLNKLTNIKSLVTFYIHCTHDPEIDLDDAIISCRDTVVGAGFKIMRFPRYPLCMDIYKVRDDYGVFYSYGGKISYLLRFVTPAVLH